MGSKFGRKLDVGSAWIGLRISVGVIDNDRFFVPCLHVSPDLQLLIGVELEKYRRPGRVTHRDQAQWKIASLGTGDDSTGFDGMIFMCLSNHCLNEFGVYGQHNFFNLHDIVYSSGEWKHYDFAILGPKSGLKQVTTCFIFGLNISLVSDGDKNSGQPVCRSLS